MYKILIIEDEEDIRQELKLLLERGLYQVTVATEFTETKVQEKAENVHLILMDVNLPGVSGMELCKSIRSKNDVPIIFVTAKNDAMDEVTAMMLGGDDYITKPYQAPVLLAHIAAVLKRTAGRIDASEDASILRYKDYVLNLHNSTITYREQIAELSKTELRICRALFSHPGEIVSRMDLIEELWDNQIFIDDNTLSVNMTRLRSRLHGIGIEDLILTKRGQGYRI